MRQCAQLAHKHTAERSAFGKPLVAQPLMRAVLADLALESEAAVAMWLRLAAALDRALLDMDAARKIERDIIEYGALINTYGAKSAARNLPKLFGGPDLGPPRPPLVPQTPEQFNSFKAALEAAAEASAE